MAPNPPHDPYDNTIPTAPADVIGDDGDLRTMRAALREGRVATLASDGHVYVGHDAGEPMTPEAEELIEAKMGQVIEMARHGFGITVHPDGRIAGNSQDQNVKVIFEPTPGVSQDQRNLISSGIADGAQVTIAPDGMVMYNKAPGAQPPTGEVALEMNRYLDAEVASGSLSAAQSAGQGLNLDVPNASYGYITPDADPPAVEFPEDTHIDQPPPGTQPGEPTTPPDTTIPPDTTTPPDTRPALEDPAEELLARAEQVERDAAASRTASLDAYEAEVGAAKVAMQQAQRSLAGASAIATAAAVQVDTAEADVVSIRAEYDEFLAKSPGNDENAEYAQSLQHGIAIAEQRAEEARLAAEIAEDDADAAKARYDQLEHDRQAGIDRANETEDSIDATEEIALVMRVGSEQLREADRLDTAADEFAARGDNDGATRLRAAADEQRAGAAHTEWEVSQLQATATPVPPEPANDPDGTPLDPQVERTQFEEFLDDEQREVPAAATDDVQRREPGSVDSTFEDPRRDSPMPAEFLGSPELDQPDLDQQDLDQPELDQPELDQPDVDQPEFEQPEFEQPAFEAPLFDEPDTGSATDFAEGEVSPSPPSIR